MTLRKTALHAQHEKLGANFTDFGGWEMPLRYGSELEEHRAVREAAGLFDLSHMGEIWVEGAQAAEYLNTALAGNFMVMSVGRAKYSLLLNERGGIIDDLISYRLEENKFLVVPNAGNATKVFAAMQERAAGFDVTLTDATDTISLIAIQGPKSVAILTKLMNGEDAAALEEMKYYSAAYGVVAGQRVLIARTGYTGEDGFELYLEADGGADAAPAKLWELLIEAGNTDGLKPAGLAARDSLRLEAGMPLYGNELSEDVAPAKANLAGVVSFKKEQVFVGREAIENAAEPERVLVGLKGLGKRAGRSGYPVMKDGETVGEVTSGQPSPTLSYPIALAYVDRAHAEIGTALDVDLRGKPQPYEVVALPFYKR